jgi:fungal STAND N-terminal Goodbye domain
MSSTTSTTTSPHNFQLIVDAALDEYTKQTGVDLAQNPLAHKLQHTDSSDGVLKLFQEREKEFKEYRDRNRKFINLLKPTVQVLHALSGPLGESISLVSCTSFILLTSLFDYYLNRYLFRQQRQYSSELMSSSQYVSQLSSSVWYL